MADFEQNCSCWELGYEICSHYENWCSEQDSIEWWNSLTEEEKASLSVTICNNCYHGFDDNPNKQVCKKCEEWIDIEVEYGINF